MPSLTSPYLFLLGLASGLTILTITSYRHVSPRWLKWLLIATGVFVISRYVTMALFTLPNAPEHFRWLRHCWYATSVGLTLPSIMAIDQLLRHPAWSPKKLLVWFSPFLAADAAVILFASPLIPEHVEPWSPVLGRGWGWLLSIVQSVFVVGFISLCVLLMRKIPSRPIRMALLALTVGQAYLGVDGLLLAMGKWYFRPFLYSEMLTLLAIWYAYETSAALQRAGS